MVMPPNDASYEIRSIPNNTVLVQGLYLGKDYRRFMDLLYQFEQLTERMLNSDSLKKSELKVRQYGLFWLYERKLETTVSIALLEDILDRHRESAERVFWNHHQLINNPLRYLTNNL